MKLIYGGVPYNTTKVRHYSVDTNDATCEPSAVQAGLTYYANGKKEVGTGKSFEFANYGFIYTNVSFPVPSIINIVEIASLNYPVQLSVALSDMKNIDFSISQTIGSVVVDGQSYPITVVVSDGEITVSCDKTIKLQIFYGRDNYT